MITRIREACGPGMLALQRRLHTCPERSFQEFETSAVIRAELERLGLQCRPVGETGLIADIQGAGAGKLLALRADMDGLEMDEQTGLDWCSVRAGFMHGCGHDFHMAALLGAAAWLSGHRDAFRGCVRLIFQPAEEIVQGAKRMIEAGVLDGVDAIFGVHVSPDLPTGTVSLQAGPRMASGDVFIIRVKGSGGHAARPHRTIDAVVAASAILLNLQTIVSREIDPLEPSVVTVGTFHGGTRYNTVAEEAVLHGTTRTYSHETRARFPKMLERIAVATAASYRASASLEYSLGCPPLINEPASTELARTAAVRLLGESALVDIDKVMGGEDFAEYLQHVPGAFAFVGCARPDAEPAAPLHNGQLRVDDDALPVCAALHVQWALDFLNKS